MRGERDAFYGYTLPGYRWTDLMRFLIILPTWVLTSDDRDIPGTIPAKPGAVGAGVPNRSSVVCCDPKAASLLAPELWRARYVQFFIRKALAK
jgi:hypothetical protein